MAAGIMSIRFLGRMIPLKARLQLMHAIVLSHLNYASVLFTGINNINKGKLDKQLKWAVRVCFELPHHATVSNVLTNAMILNSDNTRQYFLLCKFSSIITLTAKAFATSGFPHFNYHSNNRTGKYPAIPFKKDIFKNSFIRSAISAWNNLPRTIRDTAKNYKYFKKKIKIHLLEIQRSQQDYSISTRNTWRDFRISHDAN